MTMSQKRRWARQHAGGWADKHSEIDGMQTPTVASVGGGRHGEPTLEDVMSVEAGKL